MFGNSFYSGHYARGTLCAGIGLFGIAAYYARAWRKLRNSPELDSTLETPVSSARQHWPELRHLQRGMLSSFLFFMLAGAGDTQNDWLFRLVGCLMGFCAALLFGVFAVGFVALWNLWKELILQLKKAKVGSLLLSIPLALLLLGLGLGVFLLFGMLVGEPFKSPASLFPALLWELKAATIRILLWGLIVVMFYGLWKGRSHAALMLRLILLVSFSAIIVAAVTFGFRWITSQTAPLLVILLSAIGILNVIFYSRWVRLAALKVRTYETPTGNLPTRVTMPEEKNTRKK